MEQKQMKLKFKGTEMIVGWCGFRLTWYFYFIRGIFPNFG